MTTVPSVRGAKFRALVTLQSQWKSAMTISLHLKGIWRLWAINRQVGIVGMGQMTTTGAWRIFGQCNYLIEMFTERNNLNYLVFGLNHV
uniref:Uncharacterized protein n=1 Tax=Cucumis sativus TaxID=3659 RepID=A0A0A0KP29_CUCSA